MQSPGSRNMTGAIESDHLKEKLADYGCRAHKLPTTGLRMRVLTPETHVVRGQSVAAHDVEADVIYHPLSDQEFCQLGQASENGRSWSTGLDFGDLLDLPALAHGELRRLPPLYFGYSELNPSALKLRITSRTRSSLVNARSRPRPCPGPTAALSGPAARSPPTRCPRARPAPAVGRRPSSSSSSSS